MLFKPLFNYKHLNNVLVSNTPSKRLIFVKIVNMLSVPTASCYNQATEAIMC